MLQLVIAMALITSSLCGDPKDMAGFWGDQLGHKIDFKAYTGKCSFTQATRKLISITNRELLVCSISSSGLME